MLCRTLWTIHFTICFGGGGGGSARQGLIQKHPEGPNIYLLWCDALQDITDNPLYHMFLGGVGGGGGSAGQGLIKKHPEGASIYLLWCDALQDITDNPLYHMFLFKSLVSRFYFCLIVL